jgi:hypothetical protein
MPPKKRHATNKQVRAVMRFHLKNFNDEGVTINDATIHKTVLSDSDGFGDANSKAIYKAAMRWTFARTQLGDPAWPSDWMDKSVAQLADHFMAPA